MVNLIGIAPTTSLHATGAIAVFRRQMTPNWQAEHRPVVENMVDLVGIEPTTSPMPWNSQNSISLTAKGLIVG
jgi:hypothetical protein